MNHITAILLLTLLAITLRVTVRHWPATWARAGSLLVVALTAVVLAWCGS